MRELGAAIGRACRAGDCADPQRRPRRGQDDLHPGPRRLGLGVEAPVTSPTFVIARAHPRPRAVRAWSTSTPTVSGRRLELDDLDLDADLDGPVVVVEWGDGLAEDLAAAWVEIRPDPARGGGPGRADPGGRWTLPWPATKLRRVRLTAVGPRWAGTDLSRVGPGPSPTRPDPRPAGNARGELMLLLAFDTSSATVTAALHDGTSVVAERAVTDARRHAEVLAPALADVLDAPGVTGPRHGHRRRGRARARSPACGSGSSRAGAVGVALGVPVARRLLARRGSPRHGDRSGAAAGFLVAHRRPSPGGLLGALPPGRRRRSAGRGAAERLPRRRDRRGLPSR